jgi:hypothetical protein
MFQINFTYLINLLLPPFLRKDRHKAWIKLILSNIYKLYIEFMSFKTLKLYDINFNGQTMYLEKKLQDTFGIPGLYISDGLLLNEVYFSNKDEDNIPLYFPNIAEETDTNYFYNIDEYTFDAFFIINIPSINYILLTSDDLAKMRKIIEYYKLIDKTYIIKSI